MQRHVAAEALPLRPRTVTDARHARCVLLYAPRDRRVLPRWGINSPIRDHGPTPGQHTGTISWTSRDHYLTITVPQAIAARPHVLERHHIHPDTFLRWITAKTLYAQQHRSGRGVIVRPQTLAGLLQTSLSTIHRCQRAARDPELGLEIVITPGRMLSEIECYKARRHGSPQRGLATVTAFVIPAWLPRPVENLTPRVQRFVHHDTPTSGEGLSSSVENLFTFKQASGRPKGAPLRSAPPRRRRPSPAWHLAHDLTQRAIFLKRCPPGRIANQLHAYQLAPKPWRARQLLDAMDRINIRLGYSSPTKARTAPWALLAWYLKQIDPIADHPAFNQPLTTRQ